MRIKTIIFVILSVVVVLLGDLIQRTLLPLVLKCLPRKEEDILGVWSRWLSASFIGLARVTGVGDFDVKPTIPSDPGVLILMNHQSLLDIPLVVLCTKDGCPLIVTRESYASGIPLISGIVRLLKCPTVKRSKTDFDKLHKAAMTAKSIVLYPEGARSRNGELLPFQQGALRVFLEVGNRKVYLLVTDGIWRCSTFYHITSLKEKLDCKTKILGPFDTPENMEDVDGWIEEMEGRMKEGLASLRGEEDYEPEVPLTLFGEMP